MTPRIVLAALLASTSLSGRDSTGPEDGRVEKLEVNSIARDRAAGWLRVHLPKTAIGSRQSYRGDVTLSGVPLPVSLPATVMVQPPARGFDAVFLLDLELARVTEPLLSRGGVDGLELSLDGMLTGDRASRCPVHARGLLRIGTSDIVARASDASSFVRFGGARFAGLSLKETRGEATVLLFNPLSVPVGIVEIRYALFVKDRKVAEGVRSRIQLHPRRENAVALPVIARNTDLLATVGGAAMNGGSVSGRLTGSVTLKVGAGRRVFAIDLPGTVDLLR